MTTETFHGARVFQDANEPVVVSSVKTSTIGMLQAVDPSDLPSGVDLNTPISVRKPSDAAELPDAVKAELATVFDNNGGEVILTFVDQGEDAAAKATNAAGDETTKTGIHALRKAAAMGLSVPKLICLPGVARATTGTADPVIAAAISLTDDLRAQIYIDGPNTTIADAKAAAALIGAQRRVCMSDPDVLKAVAGQSVAKPSSTLFAAVQSNLDRTRNVAWPATNVIANGVVGVNRPVDYGTEATELNEAGVNTIINRGDGFRLWGPTTLAAQEAGGIWKFANVVRATDFVNESLERVFMRFVGRPISGATLPLMVQAGAFALADFENENILLPGSRFGLDTSNTPTTGVQGIIKFGMAFEVPAPIYDLRITAYRSIEIGYTALFNSITGTFDIAETA
ncbi:hypothetical protein AN189_07230 [Loktanella sp. 3ANDIMAR09]|uniref:phage tail sheath subtilisin-like domain-containing protein n=1 Tax=Loktanella sp. 3ANDIMAR09 TaxID=1225657 RepID=UPI0007007C35|nr:phage tail sheath subtilisin-like domain-containing protein [Loktanella sp. 3ANDIMAR09]KQI68693.1 hypothetical protein AN189_07230 [Loktanella sp. 3ANDIMAR09]